MAETYDTLIIGAGHNGLVCAAYLGMAGLKVKVVERRQVVGGAAVTEEFHPGFRNSVAAYTVSLLNPKVIRDLDLAAHGLKVVERRALNFLPTEDGRYLLTGEGRTKAEIAKFSERDAALYDAYGAELDTITDVLRDLVLQQPPNLVQGWNARSLREALRLAFVGKRLRQLDMERQRALLDLFAKSAADYLDRFFESEPIKAVLGFDAVVGNYASPYTPNSAYVLLHHCFGEVNGKKGIWGHALGGMGAITQAMARACEDAGVEISLEAPVARVLVDGGKVRGVKLESGEEIAASIVASNAGPALLYRQLVDQSDLDDDFKRRIKGYKTCSGTFRMNVALSELPDFSVLSGKQQAEHHTAGIIIAPGMDYMDQAFIDAQQHGWSKKPIVEIKIPSTVDDTLAPEGCHVASLFCQQFDPAVDWDANREKVADLIIDTVNDHAPNFRKSVIATQIHSPWDLERKFGLIGGDIMHGAMGIDQLWAARPVLGHGDYRGPIKGLYMCGAGSHPGGGVTGAPGHNAAHAILADRPLIRKILRS